MCVIEVTLFLDNTLRFLYIKVYKYVKHNSLMPKDKKIIGGILLLFAGFYVLVQTADSTRFAGLAIMAIGLYLILSSVQ